MHGTQHAWGQFHLLQSNEPDWNRDGKLDSLNLKIEIPLKPDENIHSLHLFVLFDVKLHVSYCKDSDLERFANQMIFFSVFPRYISRVLGASRWNPRFPVAVWPWPQTWPWCKSSRSLTEVGTIGSWIPFSMRSRFLPRVSTFPRSWGSTTREIVR